MAQGRISIDVNALQIFAAYNPPGLTLYPALHPLSLPMPRFIIGGAIPLSQQCHISLLRLGKKTMSFYVPVLPILLWIK